MRVVDVRERDQRETEVLEVNTEDQIIKWIIRVIVGFWVTALVCVVAAAYGLNGPSHRVGAMFAVATVWCVATAIVGVVMLEAS